MGLSNSCAWALGWAGTVWRMLVYSGCLWQLALHVKVLLELKACQAFAVSSSRHVRGPLLLETSNELSVLSSHHSAAQARQGPCGWNAGGVHGIAHSVSVVTSVSGPQAWTARPVGVLCRLLLASAL